MKTNCRLQNCLKEEVLTGIKDDSRLKLEKMIEVEKGKKANVMS
jgi:hypothetical protein